MPEWLKSFLKGVGIFFSVVALGGVATYITLLVLVPRENVEVPEVVGRKLEDATILLSQSKLGIRIRGKKFSPEVPRDIIIAQTPPPGTRVRQNRVVEVVVSEGAPQVNVPSVAGMKLREAKINLSQLGIEIANVSYAHSQLPQDEVISQDPPEGVEISRQKGVNLLVSLGPPKMYLMVPDVRGKKIEDVVKWFEKTPLTIAMIKEKSSEEEEGLVLSQSPPPGSRVEENTGIELVVSASPHKTQQISLPRQRWVLTSIEIPPGFNKKDVLVVVSDEEGTKNIKYGTYRPGEKVWISSQIMGKGEMKVYVDNELLKLKKVGK